MTLNPLPPSHGLTRSSLVLWTVRLCGAAVAACAPAVGVKPLGSETAPERIRAENLLLPKEIAEAHVATAYDAIVRCRPRYLAKHASDGFSADGTLPPVVVDGGVPESFEALRTIRAREVAEIQYLPPWEAATKYGPYYSAGVIVVYLRHGPTAELNFFMKGSYDV
jgi:hypothetical protein